MLPKQASVVIPTYNKKERLSLTLESFNYQTEDSANWEVILVDDGSTEPIDDFVKCLNPKYSLRYLRQENAGRSASRNKGIKEAAGKIIIFCDDDLIVAKEFISSHISAQNNGNNRIVHGLIYNLPNLKFFKDPIAGILYSDIESDARSMEQIRKYLISDNEVRDLNKINEQKKITFFEKILQSIFLSDNQELKWLGFTGGNTSCPRSLLEEVGMFDPDFGKKWGCEDLELGYRLYLKRAEFQYSYTAVNYHIAHHRMTFRNELEESVKKFYDKHQDPRIKYLHKLLLGEIKDPDKYLEYVNIN